MHCFHILLFSLLLLISGCGKNTADKVTQLKVTGGDAQCLAAGEKMTSPLRIQVSGKSSKNLFGKDRLLPVEGVKLLLRSPADSPVKIQPVTVVSDAGGAAEAILPLPSYTGEQIIEIIPEGDESKKITAKICTG
ncbi:MAG: hypothetical protein J6S54_00140, partial [Lentisphaeria bacterium]|nr:hypothetical protein [Lentisphaeria bacterium]